MSTGEGPWVQYVARLLLFDENPIPDLLQVGTGTAAKLARGVFVSRVGAMQHVAQDSVIYLTVKEACALAQIGRTTFYRLLDDLKYVFALINLLPPGHSPLLVIERLLFSVDLQFVVFPLLLV